MIKDIPLPAVQHVTLAVAPDKNNMTTTTWNVYLINNNDVAIENTLVASNGYGESNGEEPEYSIKKYFQPIRHARVTTESTK